MKIRVLDTETTGLDTDNDHVVEFASIDFDPDQPDERTYATILFNPGVPIPLEAMATHHIMEEDIVGRPDPIKGMQELHETIGHADYYVAHNAAYDRGMMRRLATRYGDPAKWIDTWRAACHIYPDSPSHSNQVLRYYLGIGRNLTIPRHLSQEEVQPHRALFDCIVTIEILLKMLQDHTPEELVKLSDPNLPVLQKTCRLKKYKGLEWKDVPKDYLQWIVKNPDKVDVDARHTAMHYLSNQPSLL